MKKIKISQVKIGAMVSYMALAVSILTGLLYTPWMVARIGQANYGLYTLANSLISIFMLDFGLGSAVSRFVSKYRAENNTEGINSIIGIIFKLYIAIDTVVLVALSVVFFLIESLYVKLTPAEMEQFKILYLMVAGFNLVSFPFAPLNGILNAFEKFGQLKACDLFSKLSTVAFVVIALNYSQSVTLVVGANIASQLMTILAKLIIVKVSVPIKVNFKVNSKELYKTLFGFTVWTTIISVMQRFTHSFAPSVLAMTSSSIEIAVYSPAVTLEGYFYLLGTAVNGLFLPRVSRFIAEKKEEKILPLMTKVGRYQMLFLGLVFTGFLCVGSDFMVLWMGPEYAKTYYCAAIILFPTLVGATMQIANTTVIAKNLIHYQAKFMIASGVIGLAVSYVASIFLGSIGVCLGTTITALANTAFMNYVYKKKAGINIFEFYKKCYVKAIPCFLITILACINLVKLVTLGGWRGLIIKAAVICLVFAIVFFVGYFSREEKKKLLDTVKQFVRGK